MTRSVLKPNTLRVIFYSIRRCTSKNTNFVCVCVCVCNLYQRILHRNTSTKMLIMRAQEMALIVKTVIPNSTRQGLQAIRTHVCSKH